MLNLRIRRGVTIEFDEKKLSSRDRTDLIRRGLEQRISDYIAATLPRPRHPGRDASEMDSAEYGVALRDYNEGVKALAKSCLAKLY